MTNIFPIDFEEKNDIAQNDFILFSDSEDWNKLKKAQYSNLKWEKGDPWTAATVTVWSTTTWDAWTTASVTNSGTTSAAVLDFTIPKWADGQDWAAATISVWTTTTLSAWSSATVSNSWSSSAAVLDFGIPKWDTWATWNWIASITSSKVWKTTTVTITETNSNVDTFQIQDWADGENPNAKLFTLSSTSDLTNAQSAYDYRIAWNYPIIKYGNKYYLYYMTSWNYDIWSVAFDKWTDNGSSSALYRDALQMTVSSSTITAITTTTLFIGNSAFLRPWYNYPTPFIPTYDWEPATKKYVDDKVDDTAYANTWDGVTTKAPSQNAVYDKISAMDATISWKQETLVSWTNIKTINNTSLLWSWDITISWWGSDIEYVTQAEYTALLPWAESDGKHYFIYEEVVIHVTGVTLNESSISLATAWDTYQLTATVSPNDATDKSVTWSSSDSTVATVSNTWLVTCVTPWTATITVTTTDWWFTATCGVDAWWWTPWANTVAYYPLTDDFNDHKTTWTLYNLTSNSASITTLSWVKCCNLNSSFFSANFVITTLPYSIIFWSKWKGNNSNMWFWLSFVSGWDWGWSGLKYQWQLYIRYWNPTDKNSSVWTYTLNTNWHLYTITFSSSGCKFYVDGSLIATPKNSLVAPSNNASPFYIGADEEGAARSDCYQWVTIIENKEWTAQDISDFYDLTKWDYWIS